MKSRHTQFALCIFHPLQVDNWEWGVLDLELGFTLAINNFFILTAIRQTEIKKCFFRGCFVDRFSCIVWNYFRIVEVMVSLSLPAVKQLLLGKGYSKQEEADLLTNIYNRAVKWVTLIFLLLGSSCLRDTHLHFLLIGWGKIYIATFPPQNHWH